MSDSIIQRAFAGGELAPALSARADTAKYQSGLRVCRNFIVQRHGGAANRAGFRFVAACKTDDPEVALHRYVSEIAGESVLIEEGLGYLRFYQLGAPVTVDLDDVEAWDVAINYVVGDLVVHADVLYYATLTHVGVEPPDVAAWATLDGATYEIPTPFTHLMHWVQSGRVITLTHKDEPPYELHYLAPTRWVLVPIVTATALLAPAGLVLTPGGAGTRAVGYVVTAGMADTYEETPPSAQVVNGATADPTPQAPNHLAWTAVVGAVEYYVYKDPWGNGTYGFIGTASSGATIFNDPGIDPDFALTPPVDQVLFAAEDGYPNVAAFYQQRRFFGYSNANPDSVWASRTGFPSNFGISSPVQDDDALTFRIAGNNHNPVRHLLALKSFIVMTDAGEWTVGEPMVPLTPSNLPANQQTYVGCSDTVPVLIGNAILYVQARGSVLRDLQFDQQVEGLAGRDLSIFAAHLMDGFALTEIDYQQTPQSIVWAIRSDGMLLGLTYVREQEVWGWHRHDTGADGHFEHVCVVPEPLEDACYVIVRRTIDGEEVRYIERLERRAGPDPFNAFTEAFFVDSGLTYRGTPVATIDGLDHLEGQVVALVGDGVVVFNGDPSSPLAPTYTVVDGSVTLPAPASIIHAGLPIRFAEIETLDLDVQGSAVRDKKKRVGSVTVLVEASSRNFWAGSDRAHLTQVKLPTFAVADDPAHTGPVEMNILSRFNDHGRIVIRQTEPVPLTILGVIPNIEVGG